MQLKVALEMVTITAIDIKTGKIKWQTPIEFPTRVSPLVTNGIVISGYITSVRKALYCKHIWTSNR